MKAIEEYFKRAELTDHMILTRGSDGVWLIQTRQGYFQGKTLEAAVTEALKKLPRK